MAQYLKANREAKLKKKLKSNKHFDDENEDEDYFLDRSKKKNKPNLKRMRELAESQQD